ncbi:MAG: phage tail protein [Enterocloster sp.]
MASTTITKRGKNKLLKARAGIAPLPAVTQMAFGNGADGNPPSEDDNTLKHELLRKNIARVDQISETNFRYVCILGKEDLANTTINEIALCDAEGDLVAIRNAANKDKDDDEEMSFEIDDKF